MSALVAFLLLALQMAIPSAEIEAEPIKRPNVVIILADDVGVDMIGAYEPFYADHPDPGYPNTTPAIDYLAQTGLLFRNAWTNPSCSPTRAQIITGKQGLRSGIGTVVPPSRLGLDPSHDTIPSMLRGPAFVPYHTAAVGKWHLAGTQHPPVPPGPIHPLGSSTSPWFHHYAGTINNINANYNTWPKTFGTSIDVSTDECVPAPMDFCDAIVTDYATVDTADDAIHLLRTMPEPFFLYVAFNSAHTPLNEPNDPLTAASCPGLNGDPVCDFSGDVASQTRCMVQWLDNEVGRIMCAIEDGPQKPERPTTIVFMGDNGTAGEATIAPFVPSHGKTNLYDGGINVPFIVKSPLVSPEMVGTATDALVNSTDLFATVSQITGIRQPPDPLGLRDSKGFLHVLTGLSESMRQFAYAEFFHGNFTPTAQGTPPPGYTVNAHKQAIRNLAGFKLIQIVRESWLGLVVEEEFYELPLDPHELDDKLAEALAGIEPYASNYDELRFQLDTEYPHLVTP
jgi:arylsulfatase A-like enzyme